MSESNNTPYVPPATAEKLAAPIPEGQRHTTGMQIAMSLLGNGFSDQAVFAELRAKLDTTFPDKEISDIIRYARSANPTPSGFQGNGYRPSSRYGGFARSFGPQEPAKPVRTPAEQCEWWTSGSRCSPEEMIGASPTPIPEFANEACALAIASLYAETDFLNIVCDYAVSEKGKANPKGAGKILPRDEWILWFRDKGVPQSRAGSWFRINPCTGIGSGDAGSVTNDDITDFRYALIESDELPVPMQLALYRRLQLPIAAVLLSGGGSAHAWVKIEAPNGEEYAKVVKERLLKLLKPFGVDQANSNCSRLSRLPGAVRVIKAEGDGVQRLLYLNPAVPALTEATLKQFEDSLALPAIEDRPLRTLAESAVARYREMLRNVGKLGVPYGIPDLDRISGGMKPGQTIVVAGVTGGGKTTYGLHAIYTALLAGYGVAVFSLEMDREELFDLIVSNRCEINRNKFNHGRFDEDDFHVIGDQVESLSNLPLYIDDTAMTGVDQIRLKTLALKASNKIALVVVDYIQFVNPEWNKSSREQEVATISHKLRAMARETRLPFMILSQLNDEGKLRESRVISHNANVVIMIEVKGDQVSAKITKGRGIPQDTYFLTFERTYARLVSKELIVPRITPATADPQPRLPYQDADAV